MNVVNSYISPGLLDWKNKGASIKYLKKGDLKIPIIFIRAKIRTSNLFLIATGFHLEETSGPIYLLSSSKIISSLKKILKSMNVILIPIVNQRGLLFDEKGSDENLRYNEKGINYNTCWGSNSEKCLEVSLLEKYLIELYKKYDIKFALSLHEDSTEPKKGYFWMNKINKKIRIDIQNYIKKRISSNELCRLKNVGLRKGFIENVFTIVSARDDSFENYTSTILGVPTVCAEAPFGLSLARRIFFHETTLNAIISIL